ncbi:fimbrial protein [Bordetella petrii]|nr:fimbrial protein [Bordetella petrii]
MLKFAIFFLPALCLWLAPLQSWASCSFWNVTGPQDATGAISYFPASSFQINVSANNGTVLKTITAKPTANTDGSITCTTAGWVHSSRGTTGVPGGTDGKIYPTSIEGLGMRIRYPGTPGIFPYTEPNTGRGANEVFRIPNADGSQQIQIEFIKTGPIAAGGTLTGEFARVFLRETNGAETSVVSYRFSGITITPSTPTCTMDDVHVQLGTHSITAGQLAPTPAVPFSIHVKNCPIKTRIYYRIDPTSGIVPPGSLGGPNSTLMKLDAASGAKGVGIQLLYDNGDGHPLETNVMLADNNLVLTYFDIDLKARYMPTGDLVEPGSANASATVTFTYQ